MLSLLRRALRSPRRTRSLPPDSGAARVGRVAANDPASTGGNLSPCGAACEPYLESGGRVKGYYEDFSSSLVRCEECGYTRFAPFPDSELLKRYYGTLYWSDTDLRHFMNQYQVPDPGYYSELARIVAAYGGAPRPLRIHEVGCGVGCVVNWLNQQPHVKATGSDLSQTSIAKGRELGNQAILACDLASALSEMDEKIDVFFLSHSLEHMPDPAAELRLMASALSPRGVVVVRVPNGAYIAAQLRHMTHFHWAQYPDHLHYFTPKSLDCLFASAGLKTLEINAREREDQPPLLHNTLTGHRPQDMHDPAIMIKALAANLMTCELQAVAGPLHSGQAPMPRLQEMLARAPRAERPTPQQPVIRARNSEEFSVARQGEHGWYYGLGKNPPHMGEEFVRNTSSPLWRSNKTGSFVSAWKLCAVSEAATLIAKHIPKGAQKTWRVAIETMSPDAECAPYRLQVFVENTPLLDTRVDKGQRFVGERHFVWAGGGRVTLAVSMPDGGAAILHFAMDIDPLDTVNIHSGL